MKDLVQDPCESVPSDLFSSGLITLTTVAARRQFANLISRVWFTKERAALTRYGQAIVAVVPIEDLELLEHLPRRKVPARRTGPRRRKKAS